MLGPDPGGDMKLLRSCAAAAAVVLGPAAGAQPAPADPSGVWDTTYGETHLRAKPKPGAPGVYEVIGRYNNARGRLKGELKGGVMTGWWTEPGAGPDCPTVMDNSKSWGRVTFTFEPNAFRGRWHYCDAAPAHVLDGRRMG